MCSFHSIRWFHAQTDVASPPQPYLAALLVSLPSVDQHSTVLVLGALRVVEPDLGLRRVPQSKLIPSVIVQQPAWTASGSNTYTRSKGSAAGGGKRVVMALKDNRKRAVCDVPLRSTCGAKSSMFQSNFSLISPYFWKSLYRLTRKVCCLSSFLLSA